jgi:ribulose-phosphate 3-epimerase
VSELPIRIAPSLLSADFTCLKDQVALVEAAGADYLHYDVMDGHFVRNLTMGPVVLKGIHRVATVPLDVHLMIEEPLSYAEEYVEAGAWRITYHVESREGSPKTAERIRELGASPSVTVRPDTPIERVEEHLDLVDMVLVMSVQPGWSGQGFMPETLEKTRALRDRYGFAGDVEMDGGIGPETVGQCAAAGANVFVAGSAVFRAEDPAEAVRTLRRRAETARAEAAGKSHR